MPTLAEELTALKTEEDKITGNKVANFSYDDYAYEHNDANGVDTYNVDAHQNIPNGTASILKVNSTILTKGWRAQASAITRMLMNHFLGRCSYNLNKINDHFSTLLTKLLSYLGSANGIATLDANTKVPMSQINTAVANGIATLDANAKVPMNQIKTAVANGIASLDSNGYVPTSQLSPTGVVKTVNGASPVNGNITKAQIGINNVVNTGDSATPVSGGTTKFTTGGAYTELAKKAPVNHASSSDTYGRGTYSDYGHVKLIGSIEIETNSAILFTSKEKWLYIYTNTTANDTTITCSNLYSGSALTFIVLTFSNSGVSTSKLALADRESQNVTLKANSTTILINASFTTTSNTGHLVY